eukprot:COSAG01_NODE_220_length_21453_cov_118.998361_6_plen_208_part_00
MGGCCFCIPNPLKTLTTPPREPGAIQSGRAAAAGTRQHLQSQFGGWGGGDLYRRHQSVWPGPPQISGTRTRATKRRGRWTMRGWCRLGGMGGYMPTGRTSGGRAGTGAGFTSRAQRPRSGSATSPALGPPAHRRVSSNRLPLGSSGRRGAQPACSVMTAAAEARASSSESPSAASLAQPSPHPRRRGLRAVSTCLTWPSRETVTAWT